MRGMKRWLGFLVLVAMACTGPTSAWAQGAASPRVQIEGQWFDGQARLGDTELKLNGTGVRAVAWFKGYVVGLYLEAPATTPEQAVSMPGPKRLQIRMLQTVPAEEFVKALNKGVTRNSTAQEMATLKAPLAQFARQVGALKQVRAGDVVDLDHEPGLGLVMRVNGTLRGDRVPGDALFAAVLRSFVGERPYDPKLKAGLLGHKA
jgi:Chalcone isomerase-like